MEKRDPTYIPKKSTKRQYREKPPETRSTNQRFEEEEMVVLYDSKSVTLEQQKTLEKRLTKTVKTEKMETDSTALNKLLEHLINSQAESDRKNRDLIDRLAREKSTVTHSFSGIDLTSHKQVTYPKMSEGENMVTYLAKLEYIFTLNDTQETRKCSILWSHLTASACDKLMATELCRVKHTLVSNKS